MAHEDKFSNVEVPKGSAQIYASICQASVFISHEVFH